MAYTVQDWAREKPLEYFVAFYLAHHLTLNVPAFHKELYQLAYECTVLHKFDRLLVQASRSFGKSFIFSFFLPLFLICTQNLPEIIAFSRDIKLCKKFLYYIKKEIEDNEWIRNDFGVVAGDIWAKEEIEYKRADGFRGRFLSLSKGMSPRGWHPDLAIIDDPQDSGDANSQPVLEADWEWYSKDFSGMMQKKPVIFIGTPVGPLCLLYQVKEDPRWVYREYPALNPPIVGVGKSIWPEHMNEEELERERLSIHDPAFNQEYLLQPQISENPVFKKEDFQYYESDSHAFKDEMGRGLYTITRIDPAISKREAADYTAIVTVSATPEKKPRCYVREVKQGRWSLRDGVREAFLTHQKFQQNKTAVEEHAYQLALLQEIQAEENIRGRRIGAIGVRNDRDKIRRAWKVQPMLQGGQVYFDNNDPMQKELIKQLIMFNGQDGRKDDMADAFIGCLEDIQSENLARETCDGPIIVRAIPGQPGKAIIIKGGRSSYAQQIQQTTA